MTLVGILLGTGALMGFAAISVDVGNLMWERRQLQNSADAAAFDLAFVCGTAAAPATTACTEANTTTRSTLEQRVDDNAEDRASTLLDYCAGGKALGTVLLSTCPGADVSTLRGCPAPPPAYSDATKFSWVEVHAAVDSGGSTILPYSVAQLLTGDSGTTVGACARATWGTPVGASSQSPITISQCEWEEASANGSNYAEPPVYNGSSTTGYGGAGQPALPTASEVVLLTKYSDASIPNPCEHWNGHDAPGAFSYLGTSSGCNVDAEPPAWVKGDPGSSLPCPYSEFAPLLGKVIDIPVHYCMVKVPGSGSPSGNPAVSSSPACGAGSGQSWYYIRGWGKFYVSGYKVGGSQNANIYGTSENCGGLSGGARCLRGWFTSGVISSDTVGPPGGGFGAISVVPAG